MKERMKERESEREADRERDRERERVHVCLCVREVHTYTDRERVTEE